MTKSRSLGWPGRIVVTIVLVAGVAVGTLSGLGLIFFVPFGAVGALLSIRRPDARIGWIVLALAWWFALAEVDMGWAAADLAAGTAAPLTAALAVGVWAAPGAIFYLLAVLAATFPDGRLRTGRWAVLARVAFGLGLGFVLLVALRPVILLTLPGDAGTVAAPNPIGLLPGNSLWDAMPPEMGIFPLLILVIASAVSLIVRFRRAAGIERQQLRWFVASLVFVVLSVLLGLAIAAILPPSADKGVVWYPAIAAFLTVPLAIAVAVLRYRLYEIDTIINRAVLYGLLTAILAGVSAATVGLGQRFFQGLLGTGSETTVLVATLVVVTAFTPIKNWLQTKVDRRFKEGHDPAADLAAFVAEVHLVLGPLDPDRTFRRLLEVAVTAYGADSGEVRATGSLVRTIRVQPAGGQPASGGQPAADDVPAAAASAVVSAAVGDRAATVALAGSDPSRDVTPLRTALEATLAELAGLA